MKPRIPVETLLPHILPGDVFLQHPPPGRSVLHSLNVSATGSPVPSQFYWGGSTLHEIFSCKLENLTRHNQAVPAAFVNKIRDE
ncbi:MAG: hypothetical protein K9N51_03120 [Candidatus Pacebacteria bacterium]|nr:hypothetical protein [Candidatus Paceibacterota bacterium]